MHYLTVFLYQVNEDEVVRKASSHGSGDSSLFSSALSYVNNSPDKASYDLYKRIGSLADWFDRRTRV